MQMTKRPSNLEWKVLAVVMTVLHVLFLLANPFEGNQVASRSVGAVFMFASIGIIFAFRKERILLAIFAAPILLRLVTQAL